MLNPRWICTLLVIALADSSIAFCQAVNASLVGTITDSSGAVVPNARIMITETRTGVSRTTAANESGNYTFSDLPPGTYTVTAEQTGFKRASRPGVDVVVNTTGRVDLTLEPGQVTETVEISGGAPILETERADTGRSIATKAVQDLPIGTSHNFQSLSLLVPGSARIESQHSAFFNPQTRDASRFTGPSRPLQFAVWRGRTTTTAQAYCRF